MNSMSNHPLDPNGQAPISTPEPIPTPTPEPTPVNTTPPTVTTLPSSTVNWQHYLKDKRVLAIAGGLLALGVGLGGIKLMGGKPTPPVAKADTKIEIPHKKEEPTPTPAKDNTTDPLKLPNLDTMGPTLRPQPDDDLKFGNDQTPKIKPIKNEDPLMLPTLPSVPSTPEKDPFKPTPKPMGMGMGDNDPPLLNGRIKITAGGNDNKIPEIPLGPTPGMNDKKDPKDPLTLPMIPSVPDNDKTPKLPDIPTIPGPDKKDPPKLPEIPLIDDKKPELPKIPDSPGMGGVKLPDLPGMGMGMGGGVKLPDFPPKKDDVPGLPALPKDNDPVKLPPLDPFKPDPKNDPTKIDPIKIDPIKVDPIKIDSGSKPAVGGSDFEEDLHVIEGRETYSDIAQQYLGKRECAAALERYNTDRKDKNDGVVRVPPEWVLRERYAGLFGRREEKPAPAPMGGAGNLKPAGFDFEPIPKIGETRVAPIPASDPREYVVQSATGETLKEIAQRVYGDASMWSKIFDANEKLENPRAALPRGTRLTLPK